MIWVGIANLNLFINSVVWDGNAYNPAPVWCDISSRIQVMVAVAIPAASLCINRRLYHIASITTVTTTKEQRRRAVLADLAIALGIPIVEGIVQYIPQGHRFDILEDVGCTPWTYSTPIAFVLVYTWPLLISCVSFVYCILTIRAFIRSRLQFKEVLSANNNLNSSRYFRLMCLAGTELLFGIPISAWILSEQIEYGGTRPWKGWADTHWHFSRVDQIPSLLWRANFLSLFSHELARWIIVFCGFVFFAFFGFADEAIKNYRCAFSSVARRVGYTTRGTLSSGGTSGIANLSFTGGLPSLPVFIRKETSRSVDDSFGSFDEKIANAFDNVKIDTYSPTETTSSGSSIQERDYSPPTHPHPAVISHSRHTPNIV